MRKNADNIRIVPMTSAHLDEIAELERICFSVPWSRNMLAEELDNACAAFLAAIDETNRVVGYATRVTSPTSPSIPTFAAAASRRNCSMCLKISPRRISSPF